MLISSFPLTSRVVVMATAATMGFGETVHAVRSENVATVIGVASIPGAGLVTDHGLSGLDHFMAAPSEVVSAAAPEYSHS